MEGSADLGSSLITIVKEKQVRRSVEASLRPATVTVVPVATPAPPAGAASIPTPSAGVIHTAEPDSESTPATAQDVQTTATTSSKSDEAASNPEQDPAVSGDGPKSLEKDSIES